MRSKNFLNGLSTNQHEKKQKTWKQTMANIIYFWVHLHPFAIYSVTNHYSVTNSNDIEKVLGVTIDANLNFNGHLENIHKKASKKVHVLARITPYMSIPQWKLLINSFFTSQFNYWRLTKMCHSRTMSSKTNWLQERFLWIVYNHKILSFGKL